MVGSRKIPAPFQRPSIVLGSSAKAKRTWASVLPATVKPGDTVAEVGTVQKVEQSGPVVYLINVLGRKTACSASVRVNAFVAQ